MGLKRIFKQVRDQYVVAQVEALEIPTFPKGTAVRYRMVFFGRVQKVGFRLAVCELAKRLGLTGFCANRQDGSVEAEVQGTQEQIDFLLRFLRSRKRIRITNTVTEQKPLLLDEKEFCKR